MKPLSVFFDRTVEKKHEEGEEKRPVNKNSQPMENSKKLLWGNLTKQDGFVWRMQKNMNKNENSKKSKRYGFRELEKCTSFVEKSEKEPSSGLSCSMLIKTHLLTKKGNILVRDDMAFTKTDAF